MSSSEEANESSPSMLASSSAHASSSYVEVPPEPNEESPASSTSMRSYVVPKRFERVSAAAICGSAKNNIRAATTTAKEAARKDFEWLRLNIDAPFTPAVS